MIHYMIDEDAISTAKKPFPKIGILYDSYYKNTGDKSMGIVMADFCLKLYRAGLRNVYLPQVTLYHPEFRKDIASARIGAERS